MNKKDTTTINKAELFDGKNKKHVLTVLKTFQSYIALIIIFIVARRLMLETDRIFS